MAVTITMTKELGESWATDEEFAELTDEQIIELVLEDVIELIHLATWEVKRSEGTGQ